MSHIKMKPILETKNLCKSYGKTPGINNINISVMPGEIYGFIGPNGAGKSTTIRTILGLIFPDSGEIRMFGENSLTTGPELRKRTGFVPSELNYYDGLNVKQFLQYSADFYGNDARTRINNYSERLKLDLKRKISDLSLGNRKKVALVQALLHKPELLILDEPTSGLDPLIQSRFYEILKEEQQRGCTIFFSSHILSEVERMCNRLAIIREGEIVNISGMDELKRMNIKRFRIIFKENGVAEISNLKNVRNLKTEGRVAEGIFSGDVIVLMKQLSQLPVEDIVIEDPNLEEIFMHYYKDKGDEK